MEALELLDGAARELMLFAGVGLLIGGLDELLVDLWFWTHRLVARPRRLTLATLPPAPPMRSAVFVPAWDEAGVIGSMLRTALQRWSDAEFRLYVGCYPNDPATIAAVRSVVHPRVRLVIGARPGPTTKADNLNSMWRALAADDWAADALVIHDAEDVVDADELRVLAALLATHDAVQLPVVPIMGRTASLVAGHYGDEFAESHAKLMPVRAAVGAGLPLAGTGCGLRIDRLQAVAAARGGEPFDAGSLVEDYELGLRLAQAGGRGCFARVRERDAGRLVAVRAMFPATVGAAVRQKARWMAGIALAGWDRTGWARGGALADHWMRLRDRRAPLAMVVLAAAYGALLLWGVAALAHWSNGTPTPSAPRWLVLLLLANTALLGWRLLMRMLFTARAYGAREALWSLPRFVVGNAVALMAAPRALFLYLRLLRGGAPAWDKTAHHFPDLAAEAR